MSRRMPDLTSSDGVTRPSLFGKPALATAQFACSRAHVTHCGQAYASSALPGALILPDRGLAIMLKRGAHTMCAVGYATRDPRREKLSSEHHCH